MSLEGLGQGGTKAVSGSSLKSSGELCKYSWSISSHPFSARIYQNGGGWEGGGYFGKRSPDALLCCPAAFQSPPTPIESHSSGVRSEPNKQGGSLGV